MKENMLKFSVKTTIFSDGRVIQKSYLDFDDQIANFTSTIIDTKEKQTREALIKLGWIPPT